MSPELRRDLQRFYNNLQDRPLPPDDPFYVDYIERQTIDGDPIAAIAQKIAWSEAASLELLSGQRGSGKSTQLLRLKQMLETDGCTVFLCDMKDYLNLSMPVEISDFLISLMGSLSREVDHRFQVDPARRGYWQRLTHFLQQEVKIEGIKLEAELDPVTFGIEASLKDDPDFKQRLQLALKGHVATLVRQVRTFADEVVQRVRKCTGDPGHKVVILVDSVEQIRGGEDVHKSVETLFVGHGEHLRFPTLHLVYTVPPYLVPLASGLDRNLGATLRTLPSVHVRRRNGEPDDQGITALRDMVALRHAAWSQVFSPEQLQDMALSTGGDLRDFFRLIREVLVLAAAKPDGLPVDDGLVQSAKNLIKRSMLPLAQDDSAWLRRIAASKTPELPSIRELPRLARFFDTHLVLNYRNGDDWYDVHPLLAEVLAAPA
ncbi:MAG: hypothetical protein EPN21_17610 [Methylococcaceae bacterium]|nr:MAG: hypothetical protein EPN21_17610 [Methylococcaceae bacterium]